MRVLTPPELVWLLAAVAKADRAAFEQLYAVTCGKLYGVVLRILRRKDLADEVIQDTYLQIWSSAGQFDPAVATPITWAVAIARDQAINRIRKKAEISIEEESDATDVVTETVDPAGQQSTEELKRLLACMGKLDAERQRILLLAYYSGWTREQLAARLDKPVHTVKTWLQGSLAEIGKRLGSMTSEEAHSNESLAAEYVLGTLDADERPKAQALRETNAVFAARVYYWERRLGELNSMVQAVEPPAETWEKVAARIEGVATSEKFVLPNIEEPAATGKNNIIDVMRRLRYWREGTIITGTVAATLAGLVVTSTVSPDAMPAPLRAKPHEVVKTAVVKSEVPARFVAVLQQNNTSPAFILTVDIEGRSLTVRRVAADPQAGKSYELWLLSDRFPTPQSLGVVGDTDFAVDSKLSAYDAATITGATYAVSLEPEGGSPTGVATGPILWTGRLVQALPGARRPLSQR